MSILMQPCTSITDIKFLADTDKPIIIFMPWLITHKQPILKFYTVIIKNRKAKQAKIKKKLNASRTSEHMKCHFNFC